MTSPRTPQELAEAIENLVASYFDDVRQAAQRALEHSFSVHASKPIGRESKKRDLNEQRTGKSTATRRTPEEVASIRERLYKLICAHPGESMSMFSDQLGISVRALHRPMTRLKTEGRIRSVGERNQTRYFPSIGRGSKGADT